MKLCAFGRRTPINAMHPVALLIVLSVIACDDDRSKSGSASVEPQQVQVQQVASPHGGADRWVKPDSQLPRSVKASGQLGPGRGTLIIDVKPPDGAELTEGAPFRIQARGVDLTFPKEINTKLKVKDLPARLPLDVADGAQGPVQLDLMYYYCSMGEEGSCRPERAKLNVEIDMSGGSAGGEAHLVHKPSA